jgi:hypothetical protein
MCDILQSEIDTMQKKIFVARMQNAFYAGDNKKAKLFSDRLVVMGIENTQIQQQIDRFLRI